jgi:hypothetical protein
MRFYPLFAIFLLWFIFFLPIFQGSTLFDDTIEEFYPAFYFFTESLKKGQIPFFNHHLFSSFPFLNEPQYLALNPLFLLRHLFGILNNSLYTYNLLVSLNYLLTLIFAYLFFRKRFDEGISLFGSVVYTFSMNHITTIVHPHVFDLIPLIPLIFYFLDEKPLLSAIILGISFHTGHPQKPLYLLIPIILYLVLARRFKVLILYTLALLPFILSYYFQVKDLFDFSERIKWDLRSLLESSYHIDKFVSLIIPKFYGSIEEGAVYVGGPYHFYMQMSIHFSIPALILGIYGVIKNWKIFEIRVFALSSLILFFLALGDQNPLINLIYSTGLIKGLRDPVRALHILPIFVSLFSAYGLKSFLENGDRRTAFRIILLIFVFSIPFLLQKPPIDNTEEILKFFALLILTYALLGWRGILPHSITALTFLDLYLAGNPYLKRKIDVESYYKPPFISDLSSGRLGDYRINARFNMGLALPRNSGMINGLELVDGYEPLVSKFYLDYYRNLINRVEGFEKLLDMGNIRFYITEEGFREKPDVLPRACLFFKAEVVKDSAEFFGGLKEFDVRRTVYLQDEPKGKYEEPEPCSPVRILKYDYTKIVLEYSSQKSGILYLSLPIYPYWRAKLDGKDIKILRANWAFMAFEVPSGFHKLEVYYDKRSLILTFSLWFLGILLIPLSKR